MAGSDVQVTLGADATAAVQGLTQFGASLTGLAPQVANLSKAFAGLASNLGQLSSSVSGLANGLKAAGAQGAEGLASLQKQGAGAAAAVGAVTDKAAGLLKSAGDLGRGLKAAGVEGAGALIALGEDAAPAAAVVGAVVQATLSAAEAMSEWAQRTATSSTATADARQKAQDLNTAFGQARTAFQQAGDLIAQALAPAFTALAREAAHLVQGFVDAYNKGGLLKSGLDLLVGAVKAALIPPLSLAEAFELAWIRISGSWDEMGDKWKLVQDIFNAGVKGIEANFATLARAIGEAIAGNWVDAAKDALDGVSAAAKEAAKDTPQIQRDLAAINADETKVGRSLLANWQEFGSNLGQLTGFQKPAPQSAAASVENSATDVHASAISQPPSAVSGAGKAGGADACDCDPAAAIACETTSQAGRTDAAEKGGQQRSNANDQTNLTIAGSNNELDSAFARGQTQQVADATTANKAKVDSTQAANQRITESNDKALKAFESSVKGVVNTFAAGLARMVEGGESFDKVMRQVGQKILDDFFRVVIDMVEKWAWAETEKVLATTQGQALLQALGLKTFAVEIANDVKRTASGVNSATTLQGATSAAKAAGLAQETASSIAERALNAQNAFSGAIAAISPIPFVGPSLAPGIAAEMAALASAAGGYDIPAGVNPLTQLHAQEMVLPARLANPMREMLAGFGSGGPPAAAGGHSFSFGDTHIHGAPNMSPADFKQALAEHRASVAEAVAGALHGGWRPSYRQPVGAL